MFKKFNSLLLSKYPLLWNTKILQVLCASLCIHIMFYIAGLLYPIEIVELWNYSHFRDGNTTTFSVLISILIIILWLVYYLRNNPFKSFYTLGRNYMFLEFGLIFIVFLSSATFFLTYKNGLYTKVRLNTSEVNLQKDANTVNLALHFIALDKKDFNKQTCCDSLEAKRVRDSIRLATPDANKYNNDYSENHSMYKDNDIYDERDFSYLYYCKEHIALYETKLPLLNKEELNAIATRWLKQGKKDSVLHTITEFKALFKKYGVNHKFSPESLANACFEDDNFTVKRVIETSYNDDDIYESGYYINLSSLTRSIDRVDTARANGFGDSVMWLVLLNYALGCTILLFSFRITRLKHWFIALIGIGLWTILIALIAMATRMDKGTPVFLLILWLAIIVIAIVLILNKENKLIAGILYNWALWFAPLILPLICAIILIATDVRCYTYFQDGMPCPPDPPIHIWIDSHWPLINYINIGLMIASIYFAFIPLVRKWQSNPEE